MSLPDFIYSPIAQLVERPAVNRQVVGSSPTWGAIMLTECQKLWHSVLTCEDVDMTDI